MLDLRVLRDVWTEPGAREVFEALVFHCIRADYPTATRVRPDPGDDGIDTFTGTLASAPRVWQAKYFVDGIGPAQQTQIRKAWKALHNAHAAGRIAKVDLWTLCVPVDPSVDELRWWEGWKKKQTKETGCAIELWPGSVFQAFAGRPQLKDVFALARDKQTGHVTPADAIGAMNRVVPLLIESPADVESYRYAIFVQKLEAAGITKHRAARVAFYNFELLRNAIELGGSAAERKQLNDLLERVYDLWESAYNACAEDDLGKAFVVAVERAIEEGANARLRTELPAQVVHKKGALHYWADNCIVGWTRDFESITPPVAKDAP